MATAREVFETNTFGVMAMTQAVLPQFRARRSGVVVNVTSSATLAPMPLVAVYTASKTAIEGFTASLEHELAAFGVRVKLVEPGYGPDTRFAQNSGSRLEGLIPESLRSRSRSPSSPASPEPGRGDDRRRRRRGGVARGERRYRSAPLSCRARRGGAGGIDVAIWPRLRSAPRTASRSNLPRLLHERRSDTVDEREAPKQMA